MKLKLTFLLIFLGAITIYGQNSYTITGVVISKEDNSPLPGVSVRILKASNGTQTDFDGDFSIKVKKGDVLEFSYLGYASQSITIADQKTLKIIMVEDASVLDEVIVTGYGTQKKSHLTGSISKVKNEKLDQIGVARVDDALVGQVSGVNIQATEGEAGSAPTIRIRGTGSLIGNAGPLIVVDGVPVDEDFLGSLDMNNIESFEILKDAASSAIFGSRGGNGVIIITTKSGKEGDMKISYNMLTGYKSAHQSDAYYTSVADAVALEQAATGTLSDRTRVKQLIGVDNNWQDVIFDGGIFTDHSLSLSGGTEKTKYAASFGYLNDEGVLLSDNFERSTVNLKIDYKVNKKLTLGFSANPSFTTQKRFDGSTHDILRQPSWLPVYLDENTINFVNRFRDGGRYANAQIGDYAIQRMFDDFDLTTGMPSTGSGTDISNTSNTNPAAKILERDRVVQRNKFLGSVYGKYKIISGLTFRTKGSMNYQYRRETRYQGVLSNRNGASASRLDSTVIKTTRWVLDNTLTYKKEIGKHEINAVLGTSLESRTRNYETIQGSVFQDDINPTIDKAASITNQNEYNWKRTLLSFFGRVNYAYEDKYLGSFSFRRDGSSVFGPNVKYGNFAAASVGWNVAKEDFLRDSDIVNTLKFRVSYGVTGNNDFRTGNELVDNYPYLAILDNTTTSGVSNGGTALVVNPLNIPNPDLSWERQIEFNPGLDFALFNNFLTGSIDYYKRTSDQLLLNNPVSGTTGFSNALVNLGEVQNSGIEVELRTRNISKENFRWSTTIIASKNKNELTNYGDSDGLIQSVDSKRAAEWINLVGNPISSFYGWVVDKEIPLEYINDPYHPIGASAQDVYVRDLNGDGLIDDDDKTILGSPYPDLVWSFANDFRIGNFDVSFMFQGSHGAEVRNMGDQYIFNHFNSAQDFNTSTTPDQQFIRQKIFTDSIIQDASYIALRNLNIGYNFSDNLLSKLKFSRARVYVSAQNLLYITADGYTGFNPESINNTSATTYGYQRAGSPVFSTMSLGLNLSF
ncbi:SusC/RagA family TonB-linked outer membrane protein [Polaribacter porphyrae]|uniref:SusC/RagA family TonB-linked outer membrane protein n=1 Tax=Polaribacter porphyrae TaxID=1137780 RepID=A0A2S7WR23_9FLAO|nr:TonB-dependent receptor [Polaribacter porphyrae]PQJ79731.1 SusC/RagA family TonB-linked outer membrane protein [Polaribacter porphyrae]